MKLLLFSLVLLVTSIAAAYKPQRTSFINQQPSNSITYRIVSVFFDLDALLKGRDQIPIQFNNCKSTYKEKKLSRSDHGIWGCLIDTAVKAQFIRSSSSEIITTADLYLKVPQKTIRTTIKVDFIKLIKHIHDWKDQAFDITISIELEEPIHALDIFVSDVFPILNSLINREKKIHKIQGHVEIIDSGNGEPSEKIITFDMYQELSSTQPFASIIHEMNYRVFADDFYGHTHGELSDLIF